MTDPDNPLNITDEDIGKEGRFTWRGDPCVVLRKLRGRASPAVTIIEIPHPEDAP